MLIKRQILKHPVLLTRLCLGDQNLLQWWIESRTRAPEFCWLIFAGELECIPLCLIRFKSQESLFATSNLLPGRKKNKLSPGWHDNFPTNSRARRRVIELSRFIISEQNVKINDTSQAKVCSNTFKSAHKTQLKIVPYKVKQLCHFLWAVANSFGCAVARHLVGEPVSSNQMFYVK